jgi:transportin-1
MEDGPDLLDQEELDLLVTVLIEYLAPMHAERYKLAALQSIATVLSHEMMPSALVLHFDRYLMGLSSLAVTDHCSASPGPSSSFTVNTPLVRQWVCRNIAALLESRPEFVRPHFQSISKFMLSATSNYAAEPDVALDACEFWLTLANLDDDACSAEMSDIMIQTILPALLPVLVQCMVYPVEKQEELLLQNNLESSPRYQEEASVKPVFHRSRSLKKDHGKPASPTPNSLVSHGDDDDDDEIDDDNDTEDEDANDWTLRKCAAASLDSLASVYGADPVLPHLLPVLESGLNSDSPWVQEASILALGAVADGCSIELSSSLAQLYPLLLHILSLDGSASSASITSVLPQLHCICAWTLGRYAHWAVEQVQAGAQGQLLAHVTQVFMARLGESHRRVQVACCAAFGVLLEVAGDLMVPYIQPIYQTLVSAMFRYQGQSLRMIFDVMGIMADSCGPATAEGDLPTIYVPPLLRMWSEIAARDPTDRTLLSLMESLASIALTSATNYQPYALQTYENAMAMIEQVKLLLIATDTTSHQKLNDEDVDPIICAVDLLDGIVEGMGANFSSLVESSSRYGPSVFLTVLHSLLSSHPDNVVVTSGVLMSALALLGDLARNCLGLLQPGLLELLTEAIQCMDPSQGASVCTNAVWAVGEICSKRRPHLGPGQADAVLAPLAPQIVQNLISLLMGNGTGQGIHNITIPGLAENAAACVGRLALANPGYVAPELPRFLLGWCEGLAKIRDPVERHDAFFGLVAAIYCNPKAIEDAVGAQSTQEAIVSILYAIMTWHIPDACLRGTDDQCSSELLFGPNYSFRPFPQQEAELGASLVRLIQDIKASVTEETWGLAEKGLPVNMRRLLRQSYNI